MRISDFTGTPPRELRIALEGHVVACSISIPKAKKAKTKTTTETQGRLESIFSFLRDILTAIFMTKTAFFIDPQLIRPTRAALKTL
jgi:hypothetical protein